MSRILIDTDELHRVARDLRSQHGTLADANADAIRAFTDLEGMTSSGQLPAWDANQAKAIHDFKAALPKLGEYLDSRTTGLEKQADGILNFDNAGGFVRKNAGKAGAAGAAGVAVLGGWAAYNRGGAGGLAKGAIGGLTGGKPIAEGQAEGSFFYGAQAGVEGSYRDGAFGASGGASAHVGVGGYAEGDYRVDENGVMVHGKAGVYAEAGAEAHGRIEYGPASAQGAANTKGGVSANAEGEGGVTWENGPQADAEAHGEAFAGAEANAEASADLGKIAHAEGGIGVKAGIGVEAGVGGHFGADRIGFEVDLGLSLGIGLEVHWDLSFSPSELVGGAWDFAEGVLTDPFGSLESFGSDLVGSIGDIGSALGDIGSALGDIGSSIGSALEDVGSSIIDGAGDFLDDINPF